MAKGFHELNIWKKGYVLLMEIYKITATFPSEEKYGITRQIRESANYVIANIEEVKLVIAKKPETLEWIINPQTDSISTPDTLSVDFLYTIRNRILPFEIRTENTFLSEVRWDNIDPRHWPAGDYIMGVITKDEFGNEGFGPGGGIKNTNPWLIHVLSGR